jgi:hypothetical protein
MADPRGVILVLTYARPNLLDELLHSIQRLADVENVVTVVVRQTGNESVGTILNKWKDQVKVLIELDGSADSVAENISRNRIAGYAVAFDSLGADWVLAVEEDVLLAADTIAFTKCIFNKYRKRRSFRAINLGSRLIRSETGTSTYCLTRFGLYGQASVLPRATWQKMLRLGIVKSSRSGHWDAAMEAFTKTGFCVAPNNSRYIDRGWVDATHMPSNPEDDYYKDVSASFVQENQSTYNDYHKMNLGYWWRKDLKKYYRWKNVMYWIIFISRSPFAIQTFRFLRTLRNSLKK